MITRIRARYAALPAWLKAALATFAAVFVATFFPALAGWANDVLSWAADLGSDAGTARPFPDASVLTKAAVSAVVAGASAVVNGLYRFFQSRDVLPGTPPVYPSDAPAKVAA